MKSGLIIFTRFPEAGRTKTRLIPSQGPEAAADIQRGMTEHMLRSASFVNLPDFHVQVRFEGGSADSMKAWLGDTCEYVPQGEGDLGDRMARAFADVFENGVQRAVIIGTDSPSITPLLIRLALFRLERYDLVLGPAKDGGYYLIGLKGKAAGKALPGIMEDISWGSGEVFSQTMEKARRLELVTALLPALGDVDRPEDLHLWEEAARVSGEPLISIVVPTLNEAGNLPDLVKNIAVEQGVELVVVDGGSTDDTLEAARMLASEAVSVDRGRWSQMNTGAEAASGDILLFLHADTRLPPGFVRSIRAAMEDPEVAAGAFKFSTDLKTSLMGLVEWAANRRARHFGIIFSDQAIFVRAELFHELGGFPAQPIMEDYELVRRLRGAGKFVLLDERAVTSARKWERQGTWRLTLTHQLITWAYLLGVSPERLARWYGGGRCRGIEVSRFRGS